MNYIPNAASLSKGMAHYWFELDSGGEQNKNYFLFCQTSDQRIFHATKPQLMEFINSKNSSQSLLLKPWDLIEANGKKRTRKGEPKAEDEEEEKEEEEQKGLPKKKKQKAIVLPAPSLPPVLPALMRELPFELLDMIFDGMAEPTPSVRRFIFDALKGSKVNRVVFHLINSRTIWKWYLETLGHNPPLGLAQLEIYYKKRGEFNKFARRWYSGFVRRHDVMYLSRLWEYYEEYGFKKMKKRMNSTTMYVLMMHLRGKTIGSEEENKNKNVTDYERLEIAIQQQMDEVKVEPRYSVAGFMTRPLQIAMIGDIATWDMNVDPMLVRHMLWGRGREHGGKDWWANTYRPSRTHYMVGNFIRQTLQLCEDAIRTIRGLGPEQIFTARDLTAYVWLNQVITRLLWHPLKEAMQPELFIHNFMVDIREEVRLSNRSKEQKDVEDKLSVKERESAWRIKQGEYSRKRHELGDAWAREWGPKKPKEMTKGKEKVKKEERLPFLDYDDEEEEEEEEEEDETEAEEVELYEDDDDDDDDDDGDNEGYISDNEYNQLMGITNKLNGQNIQFWN